MDKARPVRGLSWDAPFSDSSCALRPWSSIQYARSKSTVPTCDGHNDEINTTLRSKHPLPLLQSPQTPRDCPRCHWSARLPGLPAAASSTWKNNRTFALRRHPQTGSYSADPKSDAPGFQSSPDCRQHREPRLAKATVFHSTAFERRLCSLPSATSVQAVATSWNSSMFPLPGHVPVTYSSIQYNLLRTSSRHTRPTACCGGPATSSRSQYLRLRVPPTWSGFRTYSLRWLIRTRLVVDIVIPLSPAYLKFRSSLDQSKE